MSDKRINPIFEALSNVDERHIPSSKGKRLANKLAMGLAAAAVVILGVGGCVTAITMNRPAAADSALQLPEVKTGRYYLNGDVNSDMYVELTEDYIVLRITDGDSLAMFEEFCRNIGYTEEEVAINAEKHRDDYCTERKYFLGVTGVKSVPYMLLTHYDEEYAATAEDHRVGGSGYCYDGENKIWLSLVGDFYYVE
ncbi:MAG: hypothetical protein K2J77_12205 [Oscillospiraceae bacterium]|nr:hypothetical protein [Oscillospiraceae bacterium]